MKEVLEKEIVKLRRKQGRRLKKYVKKAEDSLKKVEEVIESKKVIVNKYTNRIRNREFYEFSMDLMYLETFSGNILAGMEIYEWNKKFITTNGEFLYEEFLKELDRIKERINEIKKKFYIK